MNNLDIEPLSRQSLSRQIADQLRQAILDGSLKADERLPTEDELSKRFAVSRPTIREALKRLAAQNLVRSKRGPTGGTFVNRPSVQQLSDDLSSLTTMLVGMESFSLEEINQTRLELETSCCRLAALNRSEAQLSELEEELRLQHEELSAEQFCASDVRFHRIIADAAGNRMLSFLMHAVIEALQPISNMVAYRYREKNTIVDQHQRIYEAIRNQQPDLAVEVISEQISYLASQHQQARDWNQQQHLTP